MPGCAGSSDQEQVPLEVGVLFGERLHFLDIW